MTETKTELMLSNLPSFMDRSGNNYDFITSFDSSLQRVSDNIVLLKSAIQLSTATGSDLDDIGTLFSLNRIGLESDATYRIRIQNFWQNSIGGGTRDSIKAIMANLANTTVADVTITLLETLIIYVEIVTNDPTFATDQTEVDEVLAVVKAAGVYAYALLSYFYDFTESFNNTTNILNTTANITGGQARFNASAIGMPTLVESKEVLTSTGTNFYNCRISSTFTGSLIGLYVSVDGKSTWETVTGLTTGTSLVYAFTGTGKEFSYKIVSNDAIMNDIRFELTTV